MPLDDRLTLILGTIVERYDAQPPDCRRRLVHLESWQRSGFHDWGDELPAVTRDDLDDLHTYGFVDLDFSGPDGNYLVKPTSEGRDALAALRRERERIERREPVDLSWGVVRPVLHAAVDVWKEAGAPRLGAVSATHVADDLGRSHDDLGFIRAIEWLGEADWLDVAYEGDDSLPFIRPTPRGLMATQGWPGGDGEVAAERLLTALDDVAADTSDESRRGWASRARDTLMEVGTKTLAEVISKSMGDAI